MGKSDKRRAEKMIDTQGRTAQNYLSGVQGESGNLFSNLVNMYLGPQNVPQPGTAIPRGGFGGGYTPSADGGGRTNPNGPSTGTATAGADPKAQFMSIMGNTPGTVQNLLAKRQQLEAAGYQLIPNATKGADGQPTNYDLRLPNGEVVDVIKSASTGGGSPWQWLMGEAQTPYGAANGGTAGGGQGGILGGALKDYGNIMGQYQNWANTGGLSEQDKANLRQRAVSPIRAMYERGMQDVSRQKSLQGGYAPGFTTALTRMNRNLGQGMSDATGNAEANITQMTQQGKQFGMGGMSGMYGATPGLANMFGNQVMGALGNQTNLAQLQSGLGNWMSNASIQQGDMKGFPWGKIAQGAATGIAYGAMASSRTFKENIDPVDTKDIFKKFKKLGIYEWNYKGDKTRHIGPMAEDFRDVFGKGDGKSISFIDAIGTSLALNKAIAERVGK